MVTFHVPENAETFHLLNREAIAKLKPGAIVIDAARGGVVNEEALAEALAGGKIRGVGVDVFPHEPAVSSPLFGMPAAVVTPHIGGSSAEALASVGEVISVGTALAALRGEAVPNAVNLPAASLMRRELQRLTTACGAAGRLLAVLEPDVPGAFGVTVRGVVPADVIEHVVAAALSEALQRWTNERITPVNARLLAEERGIKVRVVSGDADPARLPDFSFEVIGGEDGPLSHHVTRLGPPGCRDHGSRWIHATQQSAGWRRLDHPPPRSAGCDRLVGTILARHDVNMAGMQVGRHLPRRGGEAIMVLNVDDAIPAEALDELKGTAGIETAFVVSLPQTSPQRQLFPVGIGARH